MFVRNRCDVHAYGHLQSQRSTAAVRGAFWAAINGFAPAAVGAVVFVISSRFLIPAEFGLVALAASIAVVGTAIAPAGFGDALVQRQHLEPRHIDAVFLLCTVTSLLIYLVIVLTARPISRLMGEEQLELLLPVVGARVIFDLLAVVPNALLSRVMSFHLLALRTFVASVVAAAVCLTLLAMGFGLWALALSQLASSIAACVGSLLSVRWRPRFKLDRDALGELTRYGTYASGTRLLNLLNLDQILVGGLLGATSLGIFGFAKRIFSFVIQVMSGPLYSVSLTLLSSLQDDKEKLREAFQIASFYAAACSFPCFIGLAAVAGDLVPLIFGQQWSDAIPALQLFCTIGVMGSVGILHRPLITSMGHANLWMYYQVSDKLLALLIIFATHRHGVAAMVGWLAVGRMIVLPIPIAMTLRLLQMDLLTYLKIFLAPTLAGLMMLAGIELMRYWLDLDIGYLRAFLEIAAGTLAYTAFLLILEHKRMAYLVKHVAVTG